MRNSAGSPAGAFLYPSVGEMNPEWKTYSYHRDLRPQDVFMECSEEKEYRPSARGADEEKAQKMYPSRDLNYQGGKCTPSGRWLNSPFKSYSRIGKFNDRLTLGVGLGVGGGYVPSSKRPSPTKLVRA